MEISRSLRLSIFETPSRPILRDFAIFCYVILRARRSSCSVISSAMSWAARASTFLALPSGVG
jgi:hypothetical protein